MIYRFDAFEVDTGQFELRRDGAALPVEPLVFDLISLLVVHAGRVVTRDEIIDQVWGGRVVSDATVSSCVKSARKALGDSGDHQALIKTVRGRGFRFIGSVEAGDDASAATASAEAPAAAPPNPVTTVAPGAPSVGAPGVGAAEGPVIAVLPLKNQSADFDEYFADGLTEDIITNLARFRDLQVIARTSTFRFKGSEASLAALSAELHAAYVVTGSVRRAAGRVRISAQLVDAATGVTLWAEHYDRDLEDIFAVQDEVTTTIATTLGIKVQDAGLQRALSKSPAALDAYDSVLRARRYTADLSAEAHAEARDLLEAAVARDPRSAEAHALLANVYLAEHRFDANPRPDPIGRALAMAETAVRLDPQNAYARCWLAIVHFFRHENAMFEAEAERALALNPNDPETLADIGHFYAFMGQFARGVALSERAKRLNPLYPGWYHFSAARYHYDQRDYAAAAADVARIGMPHFYWSHLFGAAALGQLGDPAAADALARMRALKPDVDPRAELEKWNTAPDDLAHLMEGLHKAGLEETG